MQELPRLHRGGWDVMAEAAPQVRAVCARVVDLYRRQLLVQGGSGAGVRDGDAVLADAAGAHQAGECGDEGEPLPVDETSGLENNLIWAQL